jgi:NAD(P)-dependent dehydrogenase (short-subunit alcohol dehydrogenase family)
MTRKGSVALVTGAASGIGLATARRLAQEGCRVVALDRNADALQAVVEISTQKLVADVADEAAVEEVFDRAISENGHIDYVINSAGIDHLDRVAECSFADWRKILAVNLDGSFLVCRAAIRHMIARRSGRIVNLASWLGKAGMAGHAPYAASKFGIIGLTQSLAKEVAGYGITVNAVCPGPIEHTRMRAEADAQSVARGLAPASERLKLIPLGRMGEPEDVAGVICFLLSQDASYMTGQAINVTGGLWMN